MTSRRTLSLVGLILLLAGMAAADSRARIVRLSYLQGDVQIDRNDGNGFGRAFLNMPLIEGSRVRTKEDARVEIEFEDGSTLRLTPDSMVDFRELRLRNGGRSTMVSLEEGTAYFNVKRHRSDDFRVLYQQQQISLLKSSRFRIGLNKEEMKVAVMNGEIEVLKTDGVRVSLRKNETMSIEFHDANRYYLAKGVSEERHDYWDRERDDDRDRYQREREYGYSNAYAYGYNDLYRHGAFFVVSGYGRLWRPFSVQIGWDPFDAGRWVWYPGAGYVWVSPYDWGWTPYRYGSWVYVGHHGWCWRPTTVYNDWVTINRVVNAPSGYVPPARPRDRTQHVVAVGNPDVVERQPRVRTNVNGASGTGFTGESAVVRSDRGSRDVVTNETLPRDRSREGVGSSGRTGEVRDDSGVGVRNRDTAPSSRVTPDAVVDDAQREQRPDTAVRRTRDVVPMTREEVVDDARREENPVEIPARVRSTEETRQRALTPEVTREGDAQRPADAPPAMQRTVERPVRSFEPPQRMPESRQREPQQREMRHREPQTDRPARISPPVQPAPRMMPPPTAPPPAAGATRTRDQR